MTPIREAKRENLRTPVAYGVRFTANGNRQELNLCERHLDLFRDKTPFVKYTGETRAASACDHCRKILP
jgi:hypothetical protein